VVVVDLGAVVDELGRVVEVVTPDSASAACTSA